MLGNPPSQKEKGTEVQEIARTVFDWLTAETPSFTKKERLEAREGKAF